MFGLGQDSRLVCAILTMKLYLNIYWDFFSKWWLSAIYLGVFLSFYLGWFRAVMENMTLMLRVQWFIESFIQTIYSKCWFIQNGWFKRMSHWINDSNYLFKNTFIQEWIFNSYYLTMSYIVSITKQNPKQGYFFFLTLNYSSTLCAF